jgi:hypothetical protein
MQLEEPKFEAKIPAHLLDGLSEKDRWLHERVDIAAQQTEYIIRVQQLRQAEFVEHCAADAREFAAICATQKEVYDKLAELDTLRTVVSSRWSAFVFFGGAILLPLSVVIFGEWIKRAIFK